MEELSNKRTYNTGTTPPKNFGRAAHTIQSNHNQCWKKINAFIWEKKSINVLI
jgi:hypothetical protein